MILKPRCQQEQNAYDRGGYRERYAIDHGARQVVYLREHKCLKYVLKDTDWYQDANGATFDTVTQSWIH